MSVYVSIVCVSVCMLCMKGTLPNIPDGPDVGLDALIVLGIEPKRKVLVIWHQLCMHVCMCVCMCMCVCVCVCMCVCMCVV